MRSLLIRVMLHLSMALQLKLTYLNHQSLAIFLSRIVLTIFSSFIIMEEARDFFYFIIMLIIAFLYLFPALRLIFRDYQYFLKENPYNYIMNSFVTLIL